MAVQIQLRNDTAANWTSSNPVLAQGEVGVETDTTKIKIGNGTSTWTQLSYFATTTGFATESYVTTQINNLIAGAPGALNTLDELAAALNDNASFATTVTNSIAAKANSSNPQFSISLSTVAATIPYAQITRQSATSLWFDFGSVTGALPDVGAVLTLGNTAVSGSTNTTGNIDGIQFTMTSNSPNSAEITLVNSADQSALNAYFNGNSYIGAYEDSASNVTFNTSVSSTISATEISTLDGVSGNIQGQLNNKANLSGGTFTGGITVSSGSIVATNGFLIGLVQSATDATRSASGVGYMGIPSTGDSTGNTTLALGDAGRHVFSSASRTVTIPANSSVAFQVGTTITFISGAGATTSIAINSDTLRLAGAGTTGTRTLAAHGMATAVKVDSTTWYISGNGLT